MIYFNRRDLRGSAVFTLQQQDEKGWIRREEEEALPETNGVGVENANQKKIRRRKNT
jgi:hypothetical protein